MVAASAASVPGRPSGAAAQPGRSAEGRHRHCDGGSSRQRTPTRPETVASTEGGEGRHPVREAPPSRPGSGRRSGEPQGIDGAAEAGNEVRDQGDSARGRTVGNRGVRRRAGDRRVRARCQPGHGRTGRERRRYRHSHGANRSGGCADRRTADRRRHRGGRHTGRPGRTSGAACPVPVGAALEVVAETAPAAEVPGRQGPCGRSGARRAGAAAEELAAGSAATSKRYPPRRPVPRPLP